MLEIDGKKSHSVCICTSTYNYHISDFLFSFFLIILKTFKPIRSQLTSTFFAPCCILFFSCCHATTEPTTYIIFTKLVGIVMHVQMQM